MRPRSWPVLALFIILMAICPPGRAGPPETGSAPATPQALSCPQPAAELKVIMLGDTRVPYHPAKRYLLREIIQEQPQLVIHLGDIVPNGRSYYWLRYKYEDAVIKKAGIPLLPIAGNHEYFSGTLGVPGDLKGFFRNFPELKGSSWYEYTCGPLQFLGLDSQLELAPGTPQRKWLEERVANGTAPYLIIGKHVPLRTAKPKYIHPQAPGLIELFASSPRRPALIATSHSHNYERFMLDGIPQVVSGGGGTFAASYERFPDDQYHGAEPNYHYLRLHLGAKEGWAEMVRFDVETKQFAVADRFTLQAGRQ